MEQTVAQLLGGFTRREIRTNNACAGTDYTKKATGQATANWGLAAGSDLDVFLHRADELALLSTVWPRIPAPELGGRPCAPGWDHPGFACTFEDRL